VCLSHVRATEWKVLKQNLCDILSFSRINMGKNCVSFAIKGPKQQEETFNDSFICSGIIDTIN
jgi:hypothetical protein